MGLFTVPNSVKAITPLVGEIQIESEAHWAKGDYARLYVFHNRPQSGPLYEPVSQRLLPLDAQWRQGLAKVRWPTKTLPEVMGGGTGTLRALIREYLFISLFRACAESLASEKECHQMHACSSTPAEDLNQTVICDGGEMMKSDQDVGMIDDATQSEQAMRASEVSYRRLFEAAKDGILILDVDTGRINDVNPFLIKLLGFSRNEMIGKTVGELSPFKDVVSNQAMLERLQKDGYDPIGGFDETTC
jgi:PAS domain-containing protein